MDVIFWSEHLEEQVHIDQCQFEESLKEKVKVQNCINEVQKTEDVSEERKKAAASKLKKYPWLQKIAELISESKSKIKKVLEKMETKDFKDALKEVKAFLSTMTKVIAAVESIRPIPQLKILLVISQSLLPMIDLLIANPEEAMLGLKFLLAFLLKILDGLEKVIWNIIEYEPEDSKIFQKILEASNHGLQGLAAFGSGGFFAFVAANLALPAVGFGANGIVGGSLAATWMSAGPVASGSAFAILQSAGVVGLGVATGGVVVVGGGVLALGGFGIYKLVKFIKEKDNKQNPSQ